MYDTDTTSGLIDNGTGVTCTFVNIKKYFILIIQITEMYIYRQTRNKEQKQTNAEKK